MSCKACSEQRGYPYKRGHLVRLRRSKVTTKDDGEPWYPGDQRIATEGRLQGAVLISPNAVSSHLRAGREHPCRLFCPGHLRSGLVGLGFPQFLFGLQPKFQVPVGRAATGFPKFSCARPDRFF